MAFGIVGLAVIPNKLDMIEGFLNGTILSAFDFILHFKKVHWMLNNERVVIEFKFSVVKLVPSQSTGCMN